MSTAEHGEESDRRRQVRRCGPRPTCGRHHRRTRNPTCGAIRRNEPQLATTAGAWNRIRLVDVGTPFGAGRCIATTVSTQPIGRRRVRSTEVAPLAQSRTTRKARRVGDLQARRRAHLRRRRARRRIDETRRSAAPTVARSPLRRPGQQLFQLEFQCSPRPRREACDHQREKNLIPLSGTELCDAEIIAAATLAWADACATAGVGSTPRSTASIPSAVIPADKAREQKVAGAARSRVRSESVGRNALHPRALALRRDQAPA